MTDPKLMTDEELVRAEFMRRFSTWDIPVETLDVTLGNLSNEIRQTHYLEVKDILAKDAFQREINDWKRRVARTLSMGIHAGREITEVEKSGLRIMMLEIENFVEMLQKRSMLTMPTKPLRAMSDKV